MVEREREERDPLKLCWSWIRISIKKTKTMILGTPQSLITTRVNTPKLYYGTDEIELVDKFTLLGVQIDPTLTFFPHVEFLLSKIHFIEQ